MATPTERIIYLYRVKIRVHILSILLLHSYKLLSAAMRMI